jgi:hypothetical protein
MATTTCGNPLPAPLHRAPDVQITTAPHLPARVSCRLRSCPTGSGCESTWACYPCASIQSTHCAKTLRLLRGMGHERAHHEHIATCCQGWLCVAMQRSVVSHWSHLRIFLFMLHRKGKPCSRPHSYVTVSLPCTTGQHHVYVVIITQTSYHVHTACRKTMKTYGGGLNANGAVQTNTSISDVSSECATTKAPVRTIPNLLGKQSTLHPKTKNLLPHIKHLGTCGLSNCSVPTSC